MKLLPECSDLILGLNVSKVAKPVKKKFEV